MPAAPPSGTVFSTSAPSAPPAPPAPATESGAVPSTDHTLGSAVSSTLGGAVSSTRRRGADLAWLLRDHCYVRAVSVERRPVSHDEAQMAKCRLVAPSGSKWDVAEQRFGENPATGQRPATGAMTQVEPHT